MPITTSPDCLSFNVLPSGQRRARCSATMIGLAISMGATSLLFANQSKPAFAAGPLPLDLSTSLDSSGQEPSSPARLVTLSLKHEVKQGDTLWNIAQKYEVSPDAIAALNNISPETELLVGQSLKIPQTSLKPSDKVSVPEWESSLDNLRATRQRLQESLTVLRSNQSAPESGSNVIVTEEVVSSTTPETTVIEESEPNNSEIPLTVEDSPTAPATKSIPTDNPGTSAHETLAIVEPQPVPVVQPRVVLSGEQPKSLYRVQPGDTLNNIARRHKVSPQALARANQISDLDLIKVNQALVIPGSNQHPPQKKPLAPVSSLPPISPPAPRVVTIASDEVTLNKPETIPIGVGQPAPSSSQKLQQEVAHLQQNHPQTISIEVPIEQDKNGTQQPRNPEWKSPRQNSEQIVSSAAVNVENYNESLRIRVGATVEPEIPGLSNPNPHLPETTPVYDGYIWPAKGVLTSGYGVRWGRMHRGIDIAGPVGTPIVASADGEVISAGWNSGGYGNLVKVKHYDGNITLYAHNRRILVRRGEKVVQGQQLAEMGSTGFSTGPHLHFELHPQGGKAVNPIAFLPKSRGQ